MQVAQKKAQPRFQAVGEPTVLCSGKKCCPQVSESSDGSTFLIEDEGQVPVLSREEAQLLVDYFAARGIKPTV